jgi:hypothetical protein
MPLARADSSGSGTAMSLLEHALPRHVLSGIPYCGHLACSEETHSAATKPTREFCMTGATCWKESHYPWVAKLFGFHTHWDTLFGLTATRWDIRAFQSSVRRFSRHIHAWTKRQVDVGASAALSHYVISGAVRCDRLTDPFRLTFRPAMARIGCSP